MIDNIPIQYHKSKGIENMLETNIGEIYKINRIMKVKIKITPRIQAGSRSIFFDTVTNKNCANRSWEI